MNSEEELSEDNKRPFHPADPPHGSKSYDAKALEPEQQENLNKIKLMQRQDNEIYLNNHPEIRGLVSMMMRHLLDKEATSSQEIQSLLATFFKRPGNVIAAELLDYFLELNYEGPIVDDLKVKISEPDSNSDSSNEEESFAIQVLQC